MNQAENTGSTKPYLIRALHAWCTDNGLTPYLAVQVDPSVRVPREHVKDGEIVLNISFDACGGLDLGNDAISFKARFGGVARDILIPVSHVTAIYARENGQGMAFPAPGPLQGASDADDEPTLESAPPHLQAVPPPADDGDGDGDEPTPPPRAAGGHLKRVK